MLMNRDHIILVVCGCIILCTCLTPTLNVNAANFGEPCFNQSDCNDCSGGFCGGPGLSCKLDPNKCATNISVCNFWQYTGATCGGAGVNLGKGSRCGPSHNNLRCAPGVSCADDGTCGGPGAACTADAHCTFPSVCSRTSGRCGDVGAVCYGASSDDMCYFGTACSTMEFSGRGTCIKQCTNQTENHPCAYGKSCQNAECIDLPKPTTAAPTTTAPTNSSPTNTTNTPTPTNNGNGNTSNPTTNPIAPNNNNGGTNIGIEMVYMILLNFVATSLF